MSRWRAARSRAWRKEPPSLRDDAGGRGPSEAEISGDRRDRSRVDPTFDLTIPALIHIKDPTLVSVDPRLMNRFDAIRTARIHVFILPSVFDSGSRDSGCSRRTPRGPTEGITATTTEYATRTNRRSRADVT